MSEIVNIMNKVKSLHTVLYSPAILELDHSFVYLLNKLKKLNRWHFIAAILYSLPFTNSLP